MLLATITASPSACADGLPSFIVPGSMDATVYDGVTLHDGYPDDLLSGGLNAAGLQGAPPAFSDPLNPTASELRRLALYTNFRAVTDMTDAGGYGLFWGPARAPSFNGVDPGLIPGVEYKAFMKPPVRSHNTNNVPVAVQIPRHFDPQKPCVVLAPPSGSRGLYGGIAIAEWGLFEGCAAVLPGKATGTGFHLLGSAEVYDRDGVLTSARDAGKRSQFTVRDSRKLRRFVKGHPNRIAVKHAHSQINPERLWGDLALQGIEFGLWALNDAFGGRQPHSAGTVRRRTRGWGRGDDDSDRDDDHDEDEDEDEDDNDHRDDFTPENTLIIASGTSNAAGTSLRAIEHDRRGLIDGAVVIEPNINPDSAGKFAIRYKGTDFAGHGTSLYDNHTLMGLYAPCAALSASLVGTPFNLDPIGAPVGSRAIRCAALKGGGLLKSVRLAGQAEESLAILRAHGYYEEQDTLLGSHEWLNLWRALNPTYAAAHGRFAVWENVCDLSFGATDGFGLPAPLEPEAATQLFSVSGGIPPTGGVNLIDDASALGPVAENLSVSPRTGLQDLNLDGARCFRYLATGNARLLDGLVSRADRMRFRRVQRGIDETLTTGDLRGTPTILLSGRSDALVFPNYHSRPYYGLNQLVEGEHSRLSYIEVANAQHFEAFISTLWVDPVTFEVQFVPLHYYLFQALDWMKAYLEGERDDLPPSQVLRPVPRGLEAYDASDVDTALLPGIQQDPPAGDRITFADSVLAIPE
ncbi:MAG: 3-hydroxybutyrate oligomer hydrolase family protein [Gammaproteobacteria bacterium]